MPGEVKNFLPKPTAPLLQGDALIHAVKSGTVGRTSR